MLAVTPNQSLPFLNQLLEAARDNVELRSLHREIAQAQTAQEIALVAFQKANDDVKVASQARWFRERKTRKANQTYEICQNQVTAAESAAENLVRKFRSEVDEELGAILNPLPKIKRALGKLPENNPHRRVITHWLKSGRY